MDWFLDLSGESEKLETSDLTDSGTSQRLRVGERVAERFEVIEELGEGAVGVVYHARELASGRSVALKFLRRTLSVRQQERFRREGVVTAALRHPGIVSVHGAGAVGEAPYLVYEYVPGGRTLAHMLEEGAPRDELLRAVRDAALALGAAHQQGVIHRDVKPGNILITSDGAVRVADFGLVHDRELEALTQSGEMIGTPLYMPLEQFDGGGSVEPTVDVWALGVILHEAITGQTPFASVTMTELIGCLQHMRIEPRRLVPSLERGLEAICKRALERDPARRYQHAGEFAADLSRFLAGERIHGHRGWGAYAAVGVASLLLVAGLTFYLTAPHGPQAAEAPTVDPEAGPESEVARWIASVREDQDDLGKIEAAAKQLIELAPERYEGWLFLTWVEVERERLSPALDAILRAQALQPESHEVWESVGLVRMARGELEPALAAYDRAIELRPRARGHAGRAAVRLRQNDLDGAFRDCEAALKLDPKSGPALNQRGVVRLERGELLGAIEDFDASLELRRKPDVLCNRAEARLAADDVEGALKDVLEVLEGSSDFGLRGLNILARIRLSRGQLREAEEAYNKALESGEHATVFFNRASLRERRGNLAGAVEDLRRCLELDPEPSVRRLANRRLARLAGR